MKRIYTLGVLLLAILAGVVIGQSEGFVFAKDEAYLDREGYHYERCVDGREEGKCLQDGHGERICRNRGHNQKCVR